MTNKLKWKKNQIHLCSVFQKANDNCYVCNSTDQEDQLLICESCKTECCHIYCLNPKLDKVPEEQWFCDFCVKNRTLNRKLPIAGIFENEKDFKIKENFDLKIKQTKMIAPQNTPMLQVQQNGISIQIKDIKTANLLNEFNKVNDEQQNEQ